MHIYVSMQQVELDDVCMHKYQWYMHRCIHVYTEIVDLYAW